MAINYSSIKCCYCERVFDNKLKRTVEHIIPKSKGGTNELCNLSYACWECNSLRGNMDYKELKQYIQNILQNNRTIKIKSYTFIRSDLHNILNNISNN